MPKTSPIFYSPVLRLKQGEYRALQRLAPDIADRIRPRLVVPPPTERDQGENRILTKDELIHFTGRRIASYWRHREAFLETRFLIDEFGEYEIDRWLPQLFKISRGAGANPIPVATLEDLVGSRHDAFLRTLSGNTSTKIALRIESGEIDRDLSTRVKDALTALSIDSSDCTVLADFCDGEFANASIVSRIAQAALEVLQTIGPWHEVIFQGTNYPETNSAEAGSQAVIPRNEWLAWKEAIAFDENTSEHLVFGDYCADCARFQFGSRGGGRPIPHYRYATGNSWLVIRGKATGNNEDVMKEVAARVLSSGQFAGRQFSYADDYIFRTAKGLGGPGNGTTWREINTAHHITQVVRDIGTTKGIKFVDLEVFDPTAQGTLFDAVVK